MSADTTSGPSAAEFEIRLTTPLGKPASLNVLTIKWCVAGQISEERMITELPQASAAAIDLTPRTIGAFHGAMPTTTPTGCRTASARLPGLSEGITSPTI